jgi:hypothetical protein
MNLKNMDEMEFNSDDTRLITKSLQDDISKTIFANRRMFNITGDYGYLRNICMTIPETREFVSWIEANSNREKILFGAGQWGNWVRETFNNVKWDYFADNNVTSEEINGLRVLSVKELVDEHKGACIVITSKYYWKDISHQLIELGFNQDQIYLFGCEIAKVESRIYFDLPNLPKLDYEVFVDGGGYDGNSSLDFIRWAKGDYNIKIFEPDTDSKAKCERVFLANDRVNIIPKGLWSEPTYLNFESNGTESRIVQNFEIGGYLRTSNYH